MEHSEQVRFRLRLEGSLTLPDADAIRASLVSAIQENAAVEIDCSGAAEVDVSFLQLLISAHRTAAACGRSVVLAEPVAGVLQDALVRGGLLPSDEFSVTGDNFGTSGSGEAP